MHAMKHPAEPLHARDSRDAREMPSPDRNDAHDALIREIADDARVSPECYLRDTIVPEGGE
jgi:hypothetical protein